MTISFKHQTGLNGRVPIYFEKRITIVQEGHQCRQVMSGDMPLYNKNSNWPVTFSVQVLAQSSVIVHVLLRSILLFSPSRVSQMLSTVFQSTLKMQRVHKNALIFIIALKRD